MAQRGSGSIILTSSVAGLRGNARLGLYGLTKAALAQLARNLAVLAGPGSAFITGQTLIVDGGTLISDGN